jgi:hypothetical protein
MFSPFKPLPEAFWPTIKKAIDKGTNTNSKNEAITPQCPICMENLPVKSFPTEAEIDAEVLLCGHVLCQPCRKQYEQSNPRTERCPVCRTPLYCRRCEAIAIPITIPKNGEGEGSRLPIILPEGTQRDLCPDCLATVEFHKNVEKGEWPANLDDLEPGFVSLFYHIVDDIEKNGDVATEGRVSEAIADTVLQEFTNMMTSRRCVTLERGNAFRQTNGWYAENNEDQENSRMGVIERHHSPEPLARQLEREPVDIPPGVQFRPAERIVRASLQNGQFIPIFPRTAATHTDNTRQDSELQQSPFQRVGLPAYMHQNRNLANPAQPGMANGPFDIQDSTARPSAATQTSEAAQDHDMQGGNMEEPLDVEFWQDVVSQQRRNTIAATAGPNDVRPSVTTNTRAARAARDRDMHGGNMQGPWAGARAAMPTPPRRRFVRPNAVTQTSRPAGPGSLQEAMDYADAHDALGDRRDYLVRASTTRRETGESSSPAFGASQTLSSMVLEDGDEEMLSTDQPASER